MSNIQRLLFIAAAAALLIPATGALAPSKAEALDLTIAPQVDFLYSSDTPSDPDGNEGDSPSTFSFGLEVPAFFKLHPMFSVGPALGINYTTFDSGVEGADSADSNLFKLGAGIRSELHEMFAAQLLFFYDIGSRSAGENDIDVSGIEFNLDLLFRAKIDPYKTWLEVGPFFSYSSLDYEFEGTEVGSNSNISIGLAFQVAFEIGL